MTTRRSTVFMLCGIIIGLCFGIVFKNYRALELVKKCSLRPNMSGRSPLEIIGLSADDTILNSQNNLLFVGVMTAKDFLAGRATAVYDTWGREVPGRLAFFSSEGSHSDGLPVVALKGVDDRYPPQKKSFRMLYYMYEHYINHFEWFVRADDDVYINTRKLERFLRSIDSTKPQFIGQAGRGNSEEFGLLSLEFDENFCMGGPGVILSRETLRRVAPHIPTCLKNLYSTHEDVEVGRCVQKFAGIPCTWNYEMQSILHHNSSGRNAFTGNLKSKEIHNAITLHPVKRAPLMYRLHSYMKGLHAQELRQDTLSLHRDIARMKHYLQSKDDDSIETNFPAAFLNGGLDLPIFPAEQPDHPLYLGDHTVLGTKPHLNKYHTISHNDLQVWDYISRSFYSAQQANPKRKIDSAMREGLEDVITQVMDYINNFSRQRGRVIEFRELLYGYSRTNSLYGQDLILDLLLIYKKYRGKKMTVPVRRHLYVQRAFTDYFLREKNYTDENSNDGGTLSSILSRKVKHLWSSGLDKISESLPIKIPLAAKAQLLKSQPRRLEIATNPSIVFVLSLAGRYQTFQRFLRNYETVCLAQPHTNTELLLVLFREEANNDLMPYYHELNQMQNKYPSNRINHITLNGNFSRGIALNEAAHSAHIRDDQIIFFIDVDIVFTQQSLDRIRMNTIKQKQVYLPIVFSEYNPNREHISRTEFGPEAGYFRQFGFGICAIYKMDILHPDIDGFNTDITGWGLEDVKFLERIIKLNHRPSAILANTVDAAGMQPLPNIAVDAMPSEGSNNRNTAMLAIFRAPDPSLVHVYHDIYCDKSLNEAQYIMCLGTKANTLGSYKYIESLFVSNRTIIDYIAAVNKIS